MNTNSQVRGEDVNDPGQREQRKKKHGPGRFFILFKMLLSLPFIGSASKRPKVSGVTLCSDKTGGGFALALGARWPGNEGRALREGSSGITFTLIRSDFYQVK